MIQFSLYSFVISLVVDRAGWDRSQCFNLSMLVRCPVGETLERPQ